MATQSLPGESEVHYINTEIPHQQGDYIPSSTITKYRVGHYKMQQNGTYLMEPAGVNVDPETPDIWVIPAVIDVDVPIPQMNPNENLIVANGVYNLVDNDNNPDDIEIEADESEINPNINSRTGDLIKSTKTIKTFKLEKRDETRDENSNRINLGQIRVNVPQSEVNITDCIVCFNGATLTTNDNLWENYTLAHLPDSTPNSVTAFTLGQNETVVFIILVKLGVNDSTPIEYIYTGRIKGSGSGGSNTFKLTCNSNDDVVVNCYACKDITTIGGSGSNWDQVFELRNYQNSKLIMKIPWGLSVQYSSSSVGHDIFYGLSNMTPNWSYKPIKIGEYLKIINI